MKKSLIALTAIAMLAIMIPFTFAEVVWPDPCGTVPGRTPGYWKHQIQVYLTSIDGFYTNGAYSWYFDDVKMNDDYMAAILAGAGVDPLDALADLQAKGPGSEAIRNNMAYLLNYWAHLDPSTIV